VVIEKHTVKMSIHGTAELPEIDTLKMPEECILKKTIVRFASLL